MKMLPNGKLAHFKMDSKKEKLMLLGILAVVLVLALYIFYTSFAGSKDKSINKNSNFQALTSNENDVEFQVTPLSPSEFQIAINTHSVDLDFDLTEVSALYDDIGNAYKPSKWEGSEPGGHHRQGILKFPQISNNAKAIKLVITDSIRREFSWNLI